MESRNETIDDRNFKILINKIYTGDAGVPPETSIDYTSIDYTELSNTLNKYALTLDQKEWLLKKDGWALQAIPEKDRTAELCKIALKHGWGELLQFVPFKDKNLIPDKIARDLCIYALRMSHEDILQFVPDEYRTNEILRIAIEANKAAALKHIANERFNPGFCSLLVEYDGMNLECIPKEKITPELCLAAVKQNAEAIKIVLKLAPALQSPEIFSLAVSKNGDLLQTIPKDKRTGKICLDAVKNNHNAIKEVPFDDLKLVSPAMALEIWMAAVLQDGMKLKDVPRQYRTRKICLAAADQNGLALKFAPFDNPQLINPQSAHDICVAAVVQNKNAFKHVPNELRTSKQFPSLFSSILKKDGMLLDLLGENERTSEFCLDAVTQNGAALKLVPFEKRSPKILDMAVSKDGDMLRVIPREERTGKRCLAAVKNNHNAIKEVPFDDLKLVSPAMAREICMAAVLQEGMALKDVPTQYRTFEICVAAVVKDTQASKFVPVELVELQTADLFSAILKKDGMLLKILDDEDRTPEFCLDAVTQNGAALDLVPRDNRIDKVCLAAVRNNHTAIKEVPFDDLKLVPPAVAHEICMAAVLQDGRMLKYVPPQYRTPEICLAAVKQNGKSLVFVPFADKHLIPPKHANEICLAAVNQNQYAVTVVPSEYLTKELLQLLIQENGCKLADVDKALQTFDLCLSAVKNDGSSLRYIIDDDIRAKVIKELTLEKIVSDDYSLVEFLAKQPKYESEYKPAIDNLLANLKCVVVTEDGHIQRDEEVKATYSVHANSKSRLGKTIHVNKEDLDRLLEVLRVKGVKDIDLTLIDHVTGGQNQLAGLNVGDMVSLLEKNENISKLNLLGCNTAKADKFEAENEIAKRLKLYEKERSYYQSTFIVTSNPPLTTEKYAALLARTKLDRACIMAPEPGGKNFRLFYIYKNENDQICSQTFSIDELQKKGIEKIVQKGKEKSFVFQSGYNNPLRGGSTDPLNIDELENILATAQHFKKFEKQHPDYKIDKELYPFLSSITITQAQATKYLQTSLLKRVTEAIHDSPNITRPIVVKGYTKGVHADIKQQRKHVTFTYLYNKFCSFFASNKIKYKKLERDRNVSIRNMRQPFPHKNETDFKSVKVIVKK